MRKSHTNRFQRNIEDLLKNKTFLNDIAEIRQYLDIAAASDTGKEGLAADRKVEELTIKIARKYQLAYADGSPLYQLIHNNKIINYPDQTAAVCIVLPDIDRLHINEINPKTGKKEEFTIVDDPETDLEKRTRYEAYPVSVAISADASQGDVTTFLQDNWKEIKAIQRRVKPIPKYSRTRRKEKRDQFIWENKDAMPRQKLAKIIRKKFNESPEFDEQQVNSIIANLRSRYGEI